MTSHYVYVKNTTAFSTALKIFKSDVTREMVTQMRGVDPSAHWEALLGYLSSLGAYKYKSNEGKEGSSTLGDEQYRYTVAFAIMSCYVQSGNCAHWARAVRGYKKSNPDMIYCVIATLVEEGKLYWAKGQQHNAGKFNVNVLKNTAPNVKAAAWVVTRKVKPSVDDFIAQPWSGQMMIDDALWESHKASQVTFFISKLKKTPNQEWMDLKKQNQMPFLRPDGNEESGKKTREEVATWISSIHG